MPDAMYPTTIRNTVRTPRDSVPNTQAAFDAFSRQVFADGALSATMKQIVAVAVAHVTQCQRCIEDHSEAALRAGATPNELMEAIWIAAEMHADGAYAHATAMLSSSGE